MTLSNALFSCNTTSDWIMSKIYDCISCRKKFVIINYFIFCWMTSVILLPVHPAFFVHKFLFQRVPGVPGCSSLADLSLKIVFWTH